MSAVEVRNKIRSVNNTKKITKAMEMVAASKMRKTKQRMLAARPYAEKIIQVMQQVVSANSDYEPILLSNPQVAEPITGYIVIGTDRGLCGGLNYNLFRTVLNNLDTNTDSYIATIGNRASSFFSNIANTKLVASIKNPEQVVSAELFGVLQIMLNLFTEQKIHKLYIACNTLVNTMLQQPKLLQLLPIEPQPTELKWDYLYEPQPEQLIDLLLKRYTESVLHETVVENLAAEQAARMIAMKNATDNATDLINELQLIYNKARQASITKELAEIVSGADALDQD